jgi:hypothetical protein
LKFKSIMKKIGFRQNVAEPCMLMKGEKNDLTVAVVHVDDCYVIGNDKSLKDVVDQVQEHGLLVKVEHEIDKERTKAWLGQPFLLKKMLNRFKDLIDTSQVYQTPGTPGFTVVRPVTANEQISAEDQKVYRSAVGSLLYLIKYSRPDIANTVRELSKCMDKATPAAFKEMKRVMRFVAGTKDYGLKIEPHTPNTNSFMWNMVVYTDSDWAGDKDTRRSVSGYVLFLLNVPILWKSKSQQSVSLSSSEAEYYAMSEAVKDVKFVVHILEDLGIKVEMPITIKVDNIGAIFMAENMSTNSRTKHIHTRYHFIREYVEVGGIKIVFVKTIDNKADPLTKNVSGDVYEKHVNDYVADRKDIAHENEQHGRVLENAVPSHGTSTSTKGSATGKK